MDQGQPKNLNPPEGPGEVCIIADRSATPSWLAADLISQAEQDPDARVLLITHAKALAGGVGVEQLSIDLDCSRWPPPESTVDVIGDADKARRIHPNQLATMLGNQPIVTAGGLRPPARRLQFAHRPQRLAGFQTLVHIDARPGQLPRCPRRTQHTSQHPNGR